MDEKRLIDANVVLARLKTDIVLGECEKAFLRNFVNNAPNVDAVEVVHGRWIDSKHAYGFFSPKCSVCHQFNKYHERYNYCPNCGAKMDGERKDHG